MYEDEKVYGNDPVGLCIDCTDCKNGLAGKSLVDGRCYEPETHAGIDRGRDILMEFCLQI